MSSKGFYVDVDLVELLEYLWAQGHETLCSCRGDWTEPGARRRRREQVQVGFITFRELAGAQACFALLDRMGLSGVALYSLYAHSDELEYMVEFSPLQFHQAAHRLREVYRPLTPPTIVVPSHT